VAVLLFFVLLLFLFFVLLLFLFVVIRVHDTSIDVIVIEVGFVISAARRGAPTVEKRFSHS
jgi:hypothetical protein